jgi:hypothetical protein
MWTFLLPLIANAVWDAVSANDFALERGIVHLIATGSTGA